MAKQPAEQISEVNAETLSRSSEAVERMAKDNTAALADAGNASRPAVVELTKAYQELAAKNAKTLIGAMQSLAAVRSPAEFFDVQQRLVREGVEAAIKDSQRIARLTTGVFTAAIEPLAQRIDAKVRADQDRLH